MARKAGNPSQRPSLPSAHNGNAPPPSTIAAQIVSNANVRAQHDASTKVTFAQLLKDFLQHPSTDEPDAQLIELVSVIAEAGLDALAKHDPFAADQMREQGMDSLAALKLIFLRKPQLLMRGRVGEDESPRPPLCVWLFSKLLGLLNQAGVRSIHALVQDLMRTCLVVLLKTSSFWDQAVGLLRLYMSCVDDILSVLDPDESEEGYPRARIAIPSSSSISNFWPESQHFVALPHGLQTTLDTPIQGVYIGLRLLQIIFGVVQRLDGNAGFSACKHFLPWTLDSCGTLCHSLGTLCPRIEGNPICDEMDHVCLELLESTFSCIDSGVDVSVSSKAALTLASGLSQLLHSCQKTNLSVSNQLALASLLTRLRGNLNDLDSRSIPGSHFLALTSIMEDHLESYIIEICQDSSMFGMLHKDLQLAMCLWTAKDEWPMEVEELREALCADATESFSDPKLRQESVSIVDTFRELNLVNEERPAKRRKTQPERSGNDFYEQLVVTLTGESPDSDVLNLSGLHTAISEKYLNISDAFDQSEEEQGEILSAFGKIACAGSGCLEPDDVNKPHWTTASCTLCDGDRNASAPESSNWNHGNTGDDWKEAIAAMLAITQEEAFLKSSKPRVLMASAIRRVFNHISDPDYLNLENCSLGQWLLGSFSRSLRELRIAAAKAIMTFLRSDIPRNIRGKNRMSTLEFFYTLSERDVLSEQETLIMAYGQAARVCGEDELPIILLQLVEYLGHTNALICGMAYNELASIADSFSMMPIDLLRPFWRSIGFAVFKDLHNKPQKAQQLSDLTEQSVNQLLLSTHTELLPNLVLTKRKDILGRIAKARGTSIEDICTQPRRNLAGILALLLCQPVADSEVESNAMETLVSVAPAFLDNGNELESLVKLEPVMVACEVLKLAADQHDARNDHFRRGFHKLAALAEMKNGQRKSASRKKTLSSFFEIHILGIMAHFSEVLDSPLAMHPLSERKRCVGAIGEMIALAGNYVSFALPQLRACLQSAMSDAQLSDQTVLVWFYFLHVLDEEDFVPVIDQTFALIVEHWSSFSDETQLKVNSSLLELVSKHNGCLRERAEHIPSLSSIPMMAKLDSEFSRLKNKIDKVNFFSTFAERCSDENAVVVRQALKELLPFLEENQNLLHDAARSQKPLPALPALSRALLDACIRFAENHGDIPVLCAQCLGLIGGLDPYRVETVREKKHILVLTNFRRADEVIDFAAFLLERILVKVFLSTTNARAQGFLAYVMQELLRACGFNSVAVQRPRSSQPSPALQRWNEIPDAVRSTLTPFLSSRYVIHLRGNANDEPQEYPILNQEISHTTWLRTFVYDLLQKGREDNPRMIFPVLARIIRGHDLSIATFILPFAVLNAIVTGTEQETTNVGRELLAVLETDITAADQTEATKIKQCSENVFQTLDYLALWLQEKRKAVSDARVMASKTGRGISEVDEIEAVSQISSVERVLQLIPAEVISRRAVECGSYARALYHWEQYYRQSEQKAEMKKEDFAKDELLQHLQFIYAQMDEPDSIEGISAHLQVLNPEQQIMEHRKAGRWTAAQSWYEISLVEKPNDTETQINLLTCLKESGQYDSILNYVDGFHASNSFSPSTLPFAVEAAWSTGKWDQLERILASSTEKQESSVDFQVGVGKALLALRNNQEEESKAMIETLRESVSKDLSPTSTASLHACHDILVKLHALYEIETISGMTTETRREAILDNLDRRLDILGAYTSDKQYLLGVRRAAMQLSKIEFTKLDIASAWLTTARLSRKGEFTSAAFNSVLHAAQLGDNASKIEYSKLLWKDGHHRKAIQNLRGAIESNAFQLRDGNKSDASLPVTTDQQGKTPNRVKCHAQLLLAKWLDQSGQTKTMALKDAYADGLMSYPRWDKGHYYLGRYYLKLYDTEKNVPGAKQSDTMFAGEITKLVVENYIRSVVYGTKHYYQTIPKVLTLWLDMGMTVLNCNPRTPREKEMQELRSRYLEQINAHIKRYTMERMPAFAWYTAFPQIITRISHPSKSVWDVLQTIILKVASTYPQQALWSLMAVTRATQDDRRARGAAVLHKLRSDTSSKRRNNIDVKNLIIHGTKLSDALLAACDAPIEHRVHHVSLSKDLGFNHKLAPCSLVVPIEATMIPTLPSGNDSRTIRTHNPFPQDAITINSFSDDVLVLTSLQRPRKVTVRGSNGRSYGLLCKPKDDLRKDQRLMEFNAMINRALQRDIESSKRRLYIKTYGVTPLNEECGTIEWVEGLKPMRDIIIRLYRQKGVPIDYAEIRTLLAEACADPSKVGIFTHKIVSRFPPVLHEWFVETFPEPAAWFAARLRYTRSCAVMSIAGHVLGLGDRHGENVLLQEGNGGTFHVDFNCLFDKGLTFEKPELVPFRLTHNMVDAMGPQAVEGAFRTAAELTYKLLRTHEDTLITILETFVHDPTADFLGTASKRRKKIQGVPETPQEVLETVRQKVGGFVRGEMVPLSVEGYVDSLIAAARDPRNLAAMYIGWCAFF